MFGGGASAASQEQFSGKTKFSSGSVFEGGGDEYDYDVQDYTEKHSRRSKGKSAPQVKKEKDYNSTKASSAKDIEKMSAVERAEAMMSKYSGRSNSNPSTIRHKSRLPESFEDDLSLDGSSDEDSKEADFSISDSQSQSNELKFLRSQGAGITRSSTTEKQKQLSAGKSAPLAFGSRPSPPAGRPPRVIEQSLIVRSSHSKAMRTRMKSRQEVGCRVASVEAVWTA